MIRRIKAQKKEFDFDGFYSWCESQKMPVFISEYSMPEDRFCVIAEIPVTRKIDQHQASRTVEKLWRPKKQIDYYAAS